MVAASIAVAAAAEDTGCAIFAAGAAVDIEAAGADVGSRRGAGSWGRRAGDASATGGRGGRTRGTPAAGAIGDAWGVPGEGTQPARAGSDSSCRR